MGLLLLIAAVILAVLGIGSLLSGSILWGIVLLVAAIVIGPGGYRVRRA